MLLPHCHLGLWHNPNPYPVLPLPPALVESRSFLGQELWREKVKEWGWLMPLQYLLPFSLSLLPPSHAFPPCQLFSLNTPSPDAASHQLPVSHLLMQRSAQETVAVQVFPKRWVCFQSYHLFILNGVHLTGFFLPEFLLLLQGVKTPRKSSKCSCLEQESQK